MSENELTEDERCHCGKELGHTGRHRSLETSVTTRRETETQEITVTYASHEEIQQVRTDLNKLSETVTSIKNALDKGKKGYGYDFWTDESLSNDCVSGETEGYSLWGSRVPETMLNAIWYSLTGESKARLLSALAVARYKELPPERTENSST